MQAVLGLREDLQAMRCMFSFGGRACLGLVANTLLHDDQHRTITVWLSLLYGGNRFVDWGAIMAASTLIAIPVVIFFLLVQRRIAFGLTAGAVKA